MIQPSIGIFDSGVGGLSVLREITRQLPSDSLVYFADQHHVPYGSRSLEEVRTLSEAITRFLLAQQCELVVVACNTASAAALHSLRSTFPNVPFVGMEPAVKPAAARSETRRVAVLATPTTFQGALFSSVVDRFARGVEVLEIIVPGLVELIETGQTEAEEILRRPLTTAIEQDVDTVALACTHYSFVIPAIEKILGPDVAIIDPAPAVARQTERLWDFQGTEGSIRYITSGEPDAFGSALYQLVGERGKVEAAYWEDGSVRGP